MKILSIFVDESGDFGGYDYHSPYYIISLIMHDQSEDISIECAHLEESLRLLGFDNHCVHTGPLIRGEQDS